MTELTAADVLADLFDCVDFEPVAHDPRHAADIVLKRLTDAGFEVRSAWPVGEPTELLRRMQYLYDGTESRLRQAERDTILLAIRALGGSHE